MKTNVTVRGRGWTTRYWAGQYYGENHREFLPAEAYDVVEDKRTEDIFNLTEPDLVDEIEGIE